MVYAVNKDHRVRRVPLDHKDHREYAVNEVQVVNREAL